MTNLLNLVSAAVTLCGALVILSAMIGTVRFPDVFCRAHALGKGLTLGLMLALVGLWMNPGTEVSGLKIVAAIVFQFLTLPVASHLLARLAYERRVARFKGGSVAPRPRTGE